MKHYFLFILLSAAIATGGCTEELQPQTCGTNGTVPDESELTEAVLNLSVNAFVVEAQAETRASIPSGTPEKETPEEKEIHNIWVFQYDAATLEIKFYFCKPYHSWERGANENTNGLIRQYIPKGKDFSEVTNKQIKWIENKLNNRPRKRLGYLTPNEKFKQIINQNSVAFAS